MTIFIFITSTFYGQNHKIICVLNEKSIKNNMFVEIEIKNQTKVNYCIVIDTLYLVNRFAHEDTFQNPLIFLENKNKKNIDIIKITNTHCGFDSITPEKKIFFTKMSGDTLLVNERVILKKLFKNGYKSSLNIYQIKSMSNLKLKIPFNLFIRHTKNDELESYDIRKNENYTGKIKYRIQKEYIDKYIPQQTIDSLKNKGYKFFMGKLVSNKVPLVLNK